MGGIARREEGAVGHRQSGAGPERGLRCGGGCICPAQRPPVVRSVMDAANGIDLGLPALQGAAPFGPALPAIPLPLPILLTVGRPAWGTVRTGEESLAEMTNSSGIAHDTIDARAQDAVIDRKACGGAKAGQATLGVCDQVTAAL